ncbi:hypothetical protein [Jiella pelagia]|uniref:Ig-like domain-containing protein n=1 Tax=Jiella pelagia TaxID=2986949 RepID=A0ABY7BVQ9_9HYPH|nr:hypothetical protein [Jiella pelagia]WAP67584.1 hypothetical protein OH818_19060 [Jiella pelagia]
MASESGAVPLAERSSVGVPERPTEPLTARSMPLPESCVSVVTRLPEYSPCVVICSAPTPALRVCWMETPEAVTS